HRWWSNACGRNAVDSSDLLQRLHRKSCKFRTGRPCGGKTAPAAGKTCNARKNRAAPENFASGRASTGSKEDMTMAGRTTQEVVSDHLALAQMGEVWRDLERNLAPDCVILTTHGVFHGHEGALRAAQLLDEQVGETQYDYR